MAPGGLCKFQVLYIINLYFSQSFLIVIAEGHLEILIRTMKAGPTMTWSLIDRLRGTLTIGIVGRTAQTP